MMACRAALGCANTLRKLGRAEEALAYYDKQLLTVQSGMNSACIKCEGFPDLHAFLPELWLRTKGPSQTLQLAMRWECFKSTLPSLLQELMKEASPDYPVPCRYPIREECIQKLSSRDAWQYPARPAAAASPPPVPPATLACAGTRRRSGAAAAPRAPPPAPPASDPKGAGPGAPPPSAAAALARSAAAPGEARIDSR